MTRFPLRFALCPTLDEGRHHGVFQRRKFGQKMMKLKHKPNTAIAKVGQRPVRAVRQLNPTTAYRALRWTIQATNEMQEGAFTRPRWSHNGHHLLCSDSQM